MTLSFDITPRKPLSHEQLQAYRDLLMDKVRESSRMDARVVSESFLLVRGEVIPAFEITLQALIESRSSKLEQVTRPFTPDMALPEAAPLNKDDIDVWAYPSEEHPEFTLHKGTYLISPTMQVRECTVCAQRGEISCRVCFSRGQVSCPTCLGGGSQSCTYCKGLGKTTCLKCEGQGRFVSSGKVLGVCDACHSTGKFVCPQCQGGKVSCLTCGGSGNQVCAQCQGKKKIACPGCQGSLKQCTGWGFQSEFRSAQATYSLLIYPGPAAALELALKDKKPFLTVDLSGGENIEKEILGSTLPETVRNAFGVLFKKTNPLASHPGRVVRRRVGLQEAFMHRITGIYNGQEFIYWVHPSTHEVVSEKNSFLEMSRQASAQAQKARVAGDWENAVLAAQESLKYHQGGAEAHALLTAWRFRVIGEGLVGALLSGGGMVLGQLIHILFFQKGVYKLMPAMTVSLFYLAVAALAGLLGGWVATAVIDRRWRWSLCAGFPAAMVGLAFLLLQGVGEWNPVRDHDQKRFEQDWSGRFSLGVSEMFWEEDLRALLTLKEKYAGSEVDLSRVDQSIAHQRALKILLDKQQSDFEQTLAAQMGVSGSLLERRRKIADLRDTYKLKGVNVKSAESALETLDASLGRQAVPARAHGTLSIVPSSSGASYRVSPLTPGQLKRSPPAQTRIIRPSAPAKRTPSVNSTPSQPKQSPKKKTPEKKKSSFWNAPPPTTDHWQEP